MQENTNIMSQNSSRLPWEHLAGVLLTGVFVAWIMVTPTYELSILPHVPLEPLLVTVGFGFLLVLLYQGVTTDLSLAVMIGMTYSALVWGPFIYLWVVCSLYSYPTWLAIIPAFIAPLGLLGASIGRRHSSVDLSDPLITMLSSEGRLIWIFRVTSSAFFAYGGIGLLSYLYAYIQSQAFGAVLVTHWGLLLVIAGGITGGLVGLFTRRWKRP
jgi:hypothetical protein